MRAPPQSVMQNASLETNCVWHYCDPWHGFQFISAHYINKNHAWISRVSLCASHWMTTEVSPSANLHYMKGRSCVVLGAHPLRDFVLTDCMAWYYCAAGYAGQITEMRHSLAPCARGKETHRKENECRLLVIAGNTSWRFECFWLVFKPTSTLVAFRKGNLWSSLHRLYNILISGAQEQICEICSSPI